MVKAPYPFVDNDYLPRECFEFFPLAWRFTDANYNVLPADALSTIRPFVEWRAQEIAYYSRRHFVESTADHRFEISSRNFSKIQRIDASPLDTDPVRTWLEDRGIPPDAPVIVSWDPKTAALVPWNVFYCYWNDFCYPVQDDLVVWPESERWALAWWHEERFSFGIRHDLAHLMAQSDGATPP